MRIWPVDFLTKMERQFTEFTGERTVFSINGLEQWISTCKK